MKGQTMRLMSIFFATAAVLAVPSSYAVEAVTTGSQATQATVGVINSKVDTTNNFINSILQCNALRKFYAPSDAKKDVKGCVGVGDYDLNMASTSNINLANGQVVGAQTNGGITYAATINGAVSGLHAIGVTRGILSEATGNGYGVSGAANASGGIGGDFSGAAYGVRTTSTSGTGLQSTSTNGYAVTGLSTNSIGVRAQGNNYGIYADLVAGSSGWAGYFAGSLYASLTYSGAFYYYSDQRLKDDIKPLTGALDKLKGIEGKTFTWNKNKVNGDKAGKTDVGVIAQDVEKVLPEAVTTNKTTGYKAVDYPRLVPLLVNAIKEQQTEIDALKQQVDALKK
jgi:hypothetical protein